MKKVMLFLAFYALNITFAQQGKHHTYFFGANDSYINEYTYLTANANSGSYSIDVDDHEMNPTNFFGGPLEEGDLIFIIQVQGVNLNANAVDAGGGQLNGVPDVIGDWDSFGEVLDYNNCGNHEFAEVLSISGSSTINLRCGLQYNYTSNFNGGKCMIVRVPRFLNMTVHPGYSVSCPPWDGETGGAVIFEVSNSTTIHGDINASGIGFHGGIGENISQTGGETYAHTSIFEGAAKGEGIAGYESAYDIYGGKYGKGALANAGGGGTNYNAGGGGGANASGKPWVSGYGEPDTNNSWSLAWDLEGSILNNGMSSLVSSGGGGRGGYSSCVNENNALIVGPNDASWGEDNRRSQGGLGGRPSDYSTGKVFFGGGGGSGEYDNGEGGNGGNAGGLVFIRSYGDVTGVGNINANGMDGEDAEGIAASPSDVITGNDGAGGGGAGGTIIIQCSGNFSGVTCNANGGNGGNQNIQLYGSTPAEASGPGGGGGGGYVRVPNTGTTVNVNGGQYGTTNSPILSEFLANGATSGSEGLVEVMGYAASTIDAAPIEVCEGNSGTIYLTGFPSPGASIVWYDMNWSPIGTGLFFNTGNITSDTSFYYASCPGTDYGVANIDILPGMSINSIDAIEPTCYGVADGELTIHINGGASPIQYSINNGMVYQGSNTFSNIQQGSYPVSIQDNGGCYLDTIFVLNGPVQSSSIDSINSCDSITWIDGLTYTDNNDTAFHILPSAAVNGCDSVIYLNLTINNQIPLITYSNGILTANQQTGASYQWFNCSDLSPIANATFNEFQPVSNGDYAVITNINGCADTSDCFTISDVSIQESSFESQFTIYPNPNSGEFKINLGHTLDEVTITITDLSGKVLKSESYFNQEIIDMNFVAVEGVYYVLVFSETDKRVLKLIKN
ncbi:MAG: T9SS type A sorting domain-containing protein [Crocinitomicaceae bacterium]